MINNVEDRKTYEERLQCLKLWTLEERRNRQDLIEVLTARRNARIASAVLAIAIPSVCLSVTRRYCVKTTARSTVQFALSDSKTCLVL